MEYRQISWTRIRKIWSTELWPGRDDVEPVTSMKYLGGYDLSLKANPVYFVGLLDEKHDVKAVNSYSRTGKTQWRSRGLWVDPDVRKRGYGTLILQHMNRDIKNLGGQTVWTIPRQDAYPTYVNAGFIQTTPFQDLEWGTNCYALASLRSLNEIAVEASRYWDRRSDFYQTHLAPMVNNGDSPEIIRRAIKPLADIEERERR